MKRSTLLVALVLFGLLIAPFAAMADAPIAEPPPGAELPPATEPPAPPPPATGIGPTCDLPAFIWEDGECTIFLDGNLSESEISTTLTIAYAVNPLLGVDIDLALILRYLKVHTPNIPGIGPLTSIQVGATCTAFVAAERLNDLAYYQCYAILSRAAGNATDVLCPALSKMITFLLGRTGTATTRQLLIDAQTAHNAFCFGKTVGIGGAKVLAMPAPAEPPPGAEPLPEPTPEPIAEPVAEYPEFCPVVAFIHEDGECVFLLAADLSTSEVVALTRAAFAANPDPFLGAGDIDTIMQYLATTTDRVFGFAVETRVLVGKTCRDLADGLGGGYVARAGHYHDCVQALARIYADFKQLGCPSLDALIVRLTALQTAGTITLAQDKALKGALASYAALCANGR